jgi:hypothetical protein
MVYDKMLEALQSCYNQHVMPTHPDFKTDHEEGVLERFTRVGFSIVTREKYPPKFQDYEEWLYAGSRFMPNMTIMRHPFGKNRPTDLIVVEHDRSFLIECKGTKERSIQSVQFNSSLPHEAIIYIMSTMDQTMIMRGDHIITPAQRAPWLEYEKKVFAVEPPNHDILGGRPRLFYFIKPNEEFLAEAASAGSKKVFDELRGITEQAPATMCYYQPPFSIVDFCMSSQEPDDN